MAGANKNTPALPALSPEAIKAALIEHGLVQPASAGSEITRIKMTGNNFSIDDDIFAVYNPVKKDPAFRVQIVDAPKVHQQLWFTPELARLTGHTELLERMGDNGMFCKSHEDEPSEALKVSENGYECRGCPVNAFVPQDQLPVLEDGSRAKKCSLGADLDVRILDDDGALADETVYTLSLSSTALVEFRGGSGRKADPSKGYSGIIAKSRHDSDDQNFYTKLILLGAEKGLTPAATLTALRMGLVLAEVRSLPATNDKGSFNWNVMSFTPIDILEAATDKALDTSEATDGPNEESGLPF